MKNENKKGVLPKPTQILIAILKMTHIFNHRQNQPKEVLKLLFIPYNLQKSRMLFYSIVLRKFTRNKESLHICRLIYSLLYRLTL